MTMKEHIQEISKVGAVNVIALGMTLSQVETSLRIAGLLVAMIYTIIKTVHLIKHWNDKKTEE